MVAHNHATAKQLLLATTLLLPAAATLGAAKRELTPADAVATARVMENQLLGFSKTNEHTSPDGHRYLLRLAYGDVRRNGVWMDLYTGSLDSLPAAQPRLCAHLFTTGLGSTATFRSAEADAVPSNEIRWVNNTQIALLWSDERSLRQVLTVDLNSCKRRWLTHDSNNIYSFVIAPDGTLLYDAQAPTPKSRSVQLWKSGFTVDESTDGWAIVEGRIDGTSTADLLQNSWFIRSSHSLRPVHISDGPLDPTMPHFRDVSTGSRSHYAIAAVAGEGPPQNWNRYTNTWLERTVHLNRAARLGTPLTPIRYAVVDLHAATAKMLWDAPFNPRGGTQWSPNGDRLLMTPTFLPMQDANPLGLTGNAAADIDVNTDTYRVLPINLTDRNVASAQWRDAGKIDIVTTNQQGTDSRAERFVLIDNQWQHATASSNYPKDADTDAGPHKPAIDIQTRQSLNTPPQVFAVDSHSGAERLLFDPNPHLLDTFKLGRVERMSGKLSNGKEWIAQLMYPADFQAGKTYPLVIQSMYGPTFGAETFSLLDSWGSIGLGLGPSDLAAYCGQMLATRNIAVLQLSIVGLSPDAKQGEEYQLAFETLAEQLSASGLIDRNKIALDGFSQNGYWVEYTLAHSAFPFAAAIASDNYDPGYIQSALSNWRELDVINNGAKPYGAGLQEWFKRTPGFNADHVHTPLRFIGQSGGAELLLAKWELYSRLRALHRPVEFYMMPDANIYPAHTPQNPRQIMAVQEGVIDWFSFWLLGREDSSPEKRQQYERWHAFAALPTVANP